MTLACDTSTPVTILRAVAHGPLGIVRSLGRLGAPVYVVDPNPRTPAAASRYCGGQFLQRLAGCSGRRNGRAVPA